MTKGFFGAELGDYMSTPVYQFPRVSSTPIYDAVARDLRFDPLNAVPKLYILPITKPDMGALDDYLRRWQSIPDPHAFVRITNF